MNRWFPTVSGTVCQIFSNHALSIWNKYLGQYSKCDFNYPLKRAKYTMYSSSSLGPNYGISFCLKWKKKQFSPAFFQNKRLQKSYFTFDVFGIQNRFFKKSKTWFWKKQEKLGKKSFLNPIRLYISEKLVSLVPRFWTIIQIVDFSKLYYGV